jgi:hypothetical protein
MKNEAPRSRRWYTTGVQRVEQMPLSLVYAVVILLGIITITASSTAASNFTIYRSVATYADRNGVVPPEYAVLPPGEVSGRYADFTPMNFRVYQALLGDSDTADVARYVAYQTLIFLAGIYLLQRFRERLGVSTAEVRWISLGAIACSLLILPFLEDKVTFFTLPLLTLVGSTGSAVAAGAGLGVMIGWTGLGISVLPVLALRREGWRDAIRTTLAAVIVTLVMMSVAGRGAVDLLSRRSDREAQDPFWYSLWAPFGDLGSPTVRSLAFVVLSTAVFVAWLQKRASTTAVIVGLIMVSLLVSNSTVPERLAMVLPLGALAFTGLKARRSWSIAVAAWAAVLLVAKVSNRAFDTTLLGSVDRVGIIGIVEVLIVNSPLLVVLAVIVFGRATPAGFGRGQASLAGRQAP